MLVVSKGMEAHYFECDSCFDALELMDAAASEIAESGIDKIREMETDSGTVEWLVSEAQKCLDRGDNDAAKLHYLKAQEISPDDEHLKKMMSNLDYHTLLDEFGVEPPMPGVDREVKIPGVEDIFKLVEEAQGFLDTGDVDRATMIYMDAENLAHENPQVKQMMLALEADEIEKMPPHIIESGKEGPGKRAHLSKKTKTDKSDEETEEENKTMLQEMIDLLRKALKKIMEDK